MALSAEDKKKIYEEEKEREDARKKLKKEEGAKRAKHGCLGCLGLVVAIVIVSAVIGLMSGDKTSKHTATPADQKKAQAKLKSDLDLFMKRIELLEREAQLVKNVSVRNDLATITVLDAWHYQPHSIRMQMAQRLWRMWALIRTPSKLDHSRIAIVDLSGNKVGGSKALAGSLIWAKD